MWDVIRYHASWIELFQLIAAIVGALLSAWALLDAIKDSMALSLSGVNGARRLIAVGNIRMELERLVIQIGFVTIGLASALLPPPYGPGSMTKEEQLQMTITRSIIVITTVIKMIGGIYQRRERSRFIRQMKWDGRNGTAASLAPPPGQDPRWRPGDTGE